MLAANGLGEGVTTSTSRTVPERIRESNPVSPGRSHRSFRHSRTASRVMGKFGCWRATWSSWAAR